MAPPSVRTAAGATTGTTTTSVVFNRPASLVNGEYLYVPIINGGAATEPSGVPSGWSLVSGSVATGTTWWAGVYRRHITDAAGEPATYTWSGGTDSMTGVIAVVQDADQTTPEHAVVARSNLSGATGTGGLTTSVADCLILSIALVDDNQTISAYVCATDPATLTEVAEQLSSGGADTGAGMAAAAKATPGATGASSYTLGGTRDNTGVLIAVQPPQGGGGITEPVTTASETDTARPVGKAKTRATATASEVDTARQLGRSKTRALGTAAVVETARPIGAVKTRAVGTAVETSTAQPAGRAKTLAVGTAAEVDAAQTIGTSGSTTIPVDPATETDQARPLGKAKTRALGTAGVVETAQPIGRVKRKPIGTATDTTQARPLGKAKTRTVGTAAEVDQATTITTPGDVVQPVTPAVETDQARPLGHTKQRPVGPALVVETALPIGRRKTRAVGTAVEASTARPLARSKRRTIGAAAETVTARPITREAEQDDIDVTVGPPSLGWAAGAPRLSAWTAGPPTL